MVRRICLSGGLLLWVLTMVLAPSAGADSVQNVAVSIVPQKYFVNKIGGDRVDVLVMVSPGESPERYEPKPRQMVALSKVKIYFACGIQFEDAWLEKITATNPEMQVVHTEAGIQKRWMEGHIHADRRQSAGETKEAERGSSEDHGATDPHVWLSPALVMLQARNILDGLLKVDPEHKDEYEGNYRNFIKELVDLDLSIRNVFWKKGNGLSFLVFHPAWGYFAEAYGLEQISVEIEGKEPKAKDLQRLIESARGRGIKMIFVQPQFSTKSARVLADAIGGKVTVADPLAENWAQNLRDVADAIVSAAR